MPLDYQSPQATTRDAERESLSRAWIGLSLGILIVVAFLAGMFWPMEKVGPNHPGDFRGGWWAFPLAMFIDLLLIPLALYAGIRSILSPIRMIKRIGWITVVLSLSPIAFVVTAVAIARR
jgi:hypothetical protein